MGGKRLVVCIAGGHSPAAVEGQFLFDQYWVTCYDNRDPTDGYSSRLNLVMETEWLPDSENINYDFVKLVIAKADTKVMVCAAADISKCNTVVDELRKQVDLFERSGEGEEAYIFSIYCFDDHKFHHWVKRGTNPPTSFP